MANKNIVVAIHGADVCNPTNFADCHAAALQNGFRQIGIEAYSTKECIEKNVSFNLAIGFDQSELGLWQKILGSNVTNILWSLDSVLGDNYAVLEQFSVFEKFVLFEVTPADTPAINKFLPMLKHGYIPQGVDLDVWKKNGVAKDIDVLYVESIVDYESIYQQLKENMPQLVFDLMMQIREIVLKNPQLTFWQICEIIQKTYELNFDKEQYLMLFKNLVYALSSEQKVRMINELSDFDLYVYGNKLWEKYLNNSSLYKGVCDSGQIVELTERAKISLYCHPISYGLGLGKSVLNASAIGTFCLSSDSPSIKAEFGDSLGYFNHSSFDNIKEKTEYYLNNNTLREAMSQKARDIVYNRHTWAKRAQSIVDIID